MSLNPAASIAQLKASDPSATVWVNANAGAGKTHVLVDRVVRLMLGGTEPSRIMCLTFTKAAAAEMANRLFDRLSKWIALDDVALRVELARLGAPAFHHAR
jgi:ATP-dependent helicase/nuclease subunit A